MEQHFKVEITASAYNTFIWKNSVCQKITKICFPDTVTKVKNNHLLRFSWKVFWSQRRIFSTVQWQIKRTLWPSSIERQTDLLSQLINSVSRFVRVNDKLLKPIKTSKTYRTNQMLSINYHCPQHQHSRHCWFILGKEVFVKILTN